MAQEAWHASTKSLNKVLSIKAEYIAMTLHNCSVCPCAKQVRNSFPTSSIQTSACFELVHMDVWGAYKVPTFDGNRFFLTMGDDFSRMTWVYLLKLKFDACVVIKQFIVYVKTQFGRFVKVIRSDNGTEFVNSVCKELFNNFGIIHQKSCAYTPQQNGVVERKN